MWPLTGRQKTCPTATLLSCRGPPVDTLFRMSMASSPTYTMESSAFLAFPARAAGSAVTTMPDSWVPSLRLHHTLQDRRSRSACQVWQ